jgi:serine/threonine protein kinase
MNTKNIQRWESVKELLHQAMLLVPERRGAYLDEVCSSDVSLRAELESLLVAEEEVRSSFMQSPPVEELIGVSPGGIEAGRGLEAGQIFSQRFQLVRKLGEGGMGQVWLAEQISPVRRQVALKLIKAGMYDEAVVQRFQSERQSLAIMDHPAIAKVFDAGTTEQGQPYFVMEYVPGLPITEYCDRKKLTIKERLELFVHACEGVQHAHQKAIIHRDLKPANILVVEVDGKPVPRIIDFGLAKATTPQIEGESLLTRVGNFVGTPAYMSPEQADAGVQDIDTRTDVYSLGVVLYVLLTGVLPLDTKQGHAFAEVLQKLREEEPARPSAKVSTNRDRSTATAEARGTEPAQLASLLRGDLDWIAMKALEKDRGRRYGTPTELAGDIQRYLNHEPVVARPASAGYRLQKYVRRHRVGVFIAASLVILLTGFAVLQGVQIRRITRERDRANRERDRATRITDFMTDMFKVSDPNQARGNSVTAREILDKASNDMGAGLSKDPEVQAQMMRVMSQTYLNMGLYARAHELAKRAMDSRMSLFGPDNRQTLDSMTQLGFILDKEAQANEAEKIERQALAGDLRTVGPEDRLTLLSMGDLAIILQHQGHYAEEEKLERKVIEVASRTLGPKDELTLRTREDLGSALWYQGRYADAEQEFRQLLDVGLPLWGSDNPRAVLTMSNLALSLRSQHRLAEAEPLYREVLAIDQRVLGPEHPETARNMDGLASLLDTEGRLAEAEKLNREALAIRLRTLGPEHREILESKANLAGLLLKEGQVHEAVKMQRETLATQLRVLGPENLDTLISQINLAEMLNHEGHYAEAEKRARETLPVMTRKLGPQHPITAAALQQLGAALAYSHRYAEATKLFHDALDKEGNHGGKGNHFSVWYSFACVAVAANRPDDALKYLREAISRGYKDGDGLLADDDLKNLRQNSDFQQLAAQLKQKATGKP